MAKVGQQKLVKRMIETGDIKQFRDIFEYAAITPLIQHLKTNHATLQNYITNVGLLRVQTIVSIASYYNVETETMFKLIANQLSAPKRKK